MHKSNITIRPSEIIDASPLYDSRVDRPALNRDATADPILSTESMISPSIIHAVKDLAEGVGLASGSWNLYDKLRNLNANSSSEADVFEILNDEIIGTLKRIQELENDNGNLNHRVNQSLDNTMKHTADYNVCIYKIGFEQGIAQAENQIRNTINNNATNNNTGHDAMVVPHAMLSKHHHPQQQQQWNPHTHHI